MRMTRRVCDLERQLGVNTTPTAQQLEIRAKVEAIRRRRCERTGVPYGCRASLLQEPALALRIGHL